MDCDVSLYDTAIDDADLSGDVAPQRAASQPTRTPHSAHPSLVPFQAFRGHGRLAGRGLRQGEVLAAGCPTSSTSRSWPTDPRFAHLRQRRRTPRRTARRCWRRSSRRGPSTEWLTRSTRPRSRARRSTTSPQALAEDAHRGPRPRRRPPSTRVSARVRQLASPVRVGDDAPDVPRAPAAQRALRPGDSRPPRLRRRAVDALREAGGASAPSAASGRRRRRT